MSHIVSIQAQARDPAAIAAACRRLGLAEPVQGTAHLFSGERTGWIVQLPDWSYPIVIETASGTVHFDNYGGCWGAPDQLHRFLQMYAVEKTKLEARKAGRSVSETLLADGSIKLQIMEL